MANFWVLKDNTELTSDYFTHQNGINGVVFVIQHVNTTTTINTTSVCFHNSVVNHSFNKEHAISISVSKETSFNIHLLLLQLVNLEEEEQKGGEWIESQQQQDSAPP